MELSLGGGKFGALATCDLDFKPSHNLNRILAGGSPLDGAPKMGNDHFNE
jgi:hypothetical protein